MNTLDALRKMVDHYPGGRPAMAVRLGKNDEVLRKELSGAHTHKMGVVDASMISTLCMEVGSPFSDLYATTVAVTSGGFVRLEVRNMPGKQDLREDMSSLLKECSDVIVKLTEALADEKISDNERRSIEKELADVFTKAQDLLKGTEARNEASRPVGLRSAA
jgi:hypothetical protein